MLRLEDVTHGMTLRGVAPASPVVVLDLRWLGGALEVRFQDASGKLGVRLLSREDESALELLGSARSNLFTGNPAGFRLAAEAVRFRFAHLFDPYLCLRTSLIEPLPHQVLAVYGDLLLRQPIRFLLADTHGSGKKVTTGLLLKELITRGEVRRCLILCPGTVADAWQEELLDRFELAFEVLPGDQLESARALKSVSEASLAIARLELLARDCDTKLRLDRPEWTWDLVVIDRVHRAPATYSGEDVVESNRFKICRLLARKARHLLLVSPTPHAGSETDFQLLLSLLDPERFEGPYREGIHATGAGDLGRRLSRFDLFRQDGSPICPRSQVHPRPYTLSDAELKLHTAVTAYAKTQLDLASGLDPDRARPVLLALSLLLRRLASSPEAIFQSLYHRRKKLEALLSRVEALKSSSFAPEFLKASAPLLDAEQHEDVEDLPPGEREPLEERILDLATAAQSLADLRTEVSLLRNAEALAKELYRAGEDSKWSEVVQVLEYENLLFDTVGDRRKLVILTEHKDSLDYAASRVSHHFGRPGSVVTVHAGLSREARRKALARFREDSRCLALIATDGTLEGSGFPGTCLLINWDLPWSAARLERRFSLLSQPGAPEAAHLFALLPSGTAEGEVFEGLLRLREQELVAGGADILETLEALFRNRQLASLILERIRTPNATPAVETALASLLPREKARLVLEERGIPRAPLPPDQVSAFFREIARTGLTSLPARTVETLVRETFESLGGSLRPAEPGRFEIPVVPEALRLSLSGHGLRPDVPERFERICFDPSLSSVPAAPWASYVRPGHPLLRAVVETLLNQHREALRLGAALVDPSDFEGNVRALFLLEQTVIDDRRTETGSRWVVARTAGFAEIGPNGAVSDSLLESFLDLRAPLEDERMAIDRILLEPWLWEDLESRAVAHVLSTLGTSLLAFWRSVRETLSARTREAVVSRMRKEIAFWDRKATSLTGKELDEKEKTGRPAQMAKKAESLQARLEKRLFEMEQERVVAVPPPVVLCRTVVVPIGLLRRLKQAARSVTLAR